MLGEEGRHGEAADRLLEVLAMMEEEEVGEEEREEVGQEAALALLREERGEEALVVASHLTSHLVR